MKFKIKGRDRTFWVVVITCLVIGASLAILLGPKIMSLIGLSLSSCDTNSCFTSCNPCPSGQTAQNCIYYPKCGNTCLCSNTPTSSFCNANAFPPQVCKQCECVPTNPCSGVTCNDYCSGNTRYYGGVCSNGQCVYGSQNCPYGCSNGQCNSPPPNPCSGVTCPNYCSGSTQYYNGYCSNGQCLYSSQNCPNGCSNGQCNTDPCAGVTCPDKCDASGNKLTSGYCSQGNCQYTTVSCNGYGCSGGVCKTDPCAGVTCPDTCVGNARKFSGTCVSGTCQYSSQDCGTAGCSNGQCLNECNNDTDCQQKYSSCSMTCSNHQCSNSTVIGALIPPQPCSQAVWKDYPTCSWDQTKCSPPTWVYLVIIGMVAVMGVAALFLKRAWSK